MTKYYHCHGVHFLIKDHQFVDLHGVYLWYLKESLLTDLKTNGFTIDQDNNVVDIPRVQYLKKKIVSLYTDYVVALEELDLTNPEDQSYLDEELNATFFAISRDNKDSYWHVDFEDLTDVPWKDMQNIIREYQISTTFIPITEEDYNDVVRNVPEEYLWGGTYSSRVVQKYKLTYKVLLKEHPSFKYKGKQYIDEFSWKNFKDMYSQNK
jgi:hypothetical protein